MDKHNILNIFNILKLFQYFILLEKKYLRRHMWSLSEIAVQQCKDTD